MPASGSSLLVAAGGVGKSFTALGLVLAVTSGTRWLDVFVPETVGRALVISAEEPSEEIRARIYQIAHAYKLGPEVVDGVDIVDIHDVHTPLLTTESTPTEQALALIEFVKKHGPYAIVIVDPLARLSGASIDGDNVAACALITVLESVASAAGGLVTGVHHTSQTARRAGLTDATAIRGATGLGDSARMVLVLTAETIDHGDPDLNARLGEIITLTRAKANHVGRWEPVQLRRGEHGVLVPLDTVDRNFIASARAEADPSEKRHTQREEQARARTDAVAEAVVSVLSEHRDGLSYRALRAQVSVLVDGISDATLASAIAALGDRIERRPGPRGAVLHCLREVKP